MGTKNNPGKFDAYKKAEPDEPMFTLLGRDKYAPTLVWLWATLYELDGGDPAKLEEARNCVGSMLDYAIAQGSPAVGLGQAAMAALLELIRAANYKVDNSTVRNNATGDDMVRVYLAKTEIAVRDDSATEAKS